MRPFGCEALVTGAAGGLGQAIARRLSMEGVKLALTDRNAEGLAAIAGDLDATSIVCDLADREQLDELLTVAAGVDILVSNAGLPATGPVDDFIVAEIDRAVDVNLRAPIMLGRAAATGMAARGGGHVVFISSMAAKLPAPGLALYAATKAGVRAFALSLRADVWASGVGVSVILPGVISDAGMWADSGLPTPKGVRPMPPTAVAAAVVRAVSRDEPEIDVASTSMRAGAVLAQLHPRSFGSLGRRGGAKAQAAQMTAAHRHNR